MTKEELHNMKSLLNAALSIVDLKIENEKHPPMEYHINQCIYKYLMIKIQEDLERVENGSCRNV